MLDRADPLAAPCPYGRTHEMHGAHAMPLEVALEPEIEIRRVDPDEHRDRHIEQPPSERAAQSPQLRNAGHHLGKAADRERFERRPDFAAGRLHFRPGDTDEAHAGKPSRTAPIRTAASASPDASPATMRDRRSTACLRRSPEASRIRSPYLTMPRSVRARNAINGTSTGCSVAVCPRLAFASASDRCSR
mgnify:CR=1 FL=1